MVCPAEVPTFWILLIAKKKKKKNPYLLELYYYEVYIFFMSEIQVKGREEEFGHMVIIFKMSDWHMKTLY